MKDSKKTSKKQLSRSSAAEYLTYISAVGVSRQSIELRYEDENVWMTQKMMAELYGVSVSAINQHIKKLFDDNELNNSVIKQYLITASDGKNYNTAHYNLQAIISVGFKIENERVVQFRKWAREIIKEYTIKGFAIDGLHKTCVKSNDIFYIPISRNSSFTTSTSNLSGS